MRRILVCTADRAERGLLVPVLKELELREDVDAQWCTLKPRKPFFPDIHSMLRRFHDFLEASKPNIVVVPTDRWEMVYVAAYAFHNNFVVAHFHAGDFGSNHPDELNRRAISCFSHIMFCETADNLYNLVRAGEEQWRIYAVGSTAFDHIKIDESLCPSEPYDLVLLHPDPVSATATKKDLDETMQEIMREPKNVIWLRPNRDRNHEIIEELPQEFGVRLDYNFGFKIDRITENLPRSQFLGLLQNCSRFIGNSSAICYEAPYFDVRTVRIGKRNRDRPARKPVPGGSQKIAEILAKIPLNEKLLRKRLVL